MRRHEDNRRCPVCHLLVSNENLGGHSGKSALTSDELFCDAHADLGEPFAEALAFDYAPRPSSVQHPLHGDTLALIQTQKAGIMAELSMALAPDGSAESIAHSIEMVVLAEIALQRAKRIAAEQIRKGRMS